MAKVYRLMPGQVFAGLYRVERILGQGTMGSVYRVVEQPSGEVRALKLMNPELMNDPKFPARFEQEAQIGSRIQSPHVVQVVASGVDTKSALPWLVMEFLDGRTLAERLEEQPRPPLALVRHILDQLFGAMSAAHAASIVHRDLKPENLILVGDPDKPFLKILDFGIAKVVRESSMTGTSAGLGTPMWTAPEQTRHGVIRPTADVWALGLLTYRLLVGKPYWKSANDPKANAFEVAVELVKGPLPTASERAAELGAPGVLPPGFDAWFARCVVRDAAQRFANAAEAHAGLVALLEPPKPAPAGTAPADANPPRAGGERALAAPSTAGQPRRAALWVLIILVLLAAAAAVAVRVFFRGRLPTFR